MSLTLGPGVVLGGRYRLAERVATGGQGDVWRADDSALGRPVAVKVLRAEYAGNAEFRDRFRREAQHAAGLSHPNVAQVFDYDEGSADAPPYLVMEYVPGESLSATIAREAPIGADRVLEVVAATAAALAVAHAAGVVHRDVKPGNLLVGHDGSIKIADFGISRAVDAIPLTRTGMLIGTPSYLAPEQAMGLPATGASDLYALGVIAFEMLTGRPPYEGPATAVLLAHRDTPLPALPTWVPAGLRDLVLDLTAKDPAARPGDAATVASRAARLRAEPAMTLPDGMVPPGAEPPFAAATAGTRTRVPPAGAEPSLAEPAQRPQENLTQVLAGPPVEEPPRRRWTLPLVAGGLAILVLAGIVGWLARPSASGGSAVAPPPSVGPAVSRSPHRPARKPTPATHRPATPKAHPPSLQPRSQPRKHRHGHGRHHH